MNYIFSFNVNDLNDIRAIAECAYETKTHIIINVSKKTVDFLSAGYLCSMIKEAKKQCGYIQVQLDHAKSLEYIEAMASTGIFDIIMADGSSLSIEDNICFTSQAKSICLKYGCQIEGEVGPLPEMYTDSSSIQYTDIDQAKTYCDRTGVDFLAVSVGNAHGYNPKGDLNYRLIEKIHNNLDKPLVLHGADFLETDSLKMAIRSGIYKINIGPELRKVYFEMIANYPYRKDFECDIRKAMEQAVFEMKHTINNFLKIQEDVGK